MSYITTKNGLKEKNIAIVAGGPKEMLPDLALLSLRFPLWKWIGVDKGALFLLNAGIKPAQIIGDFDSVSKSEFKSLSKSCPNIHKFLPEKNMTDLDLALKLATFACDKTDSSIIIFGASGGRLDHELANIMLLSKYRTFDVWLVDKYNELTILDSGSHRFISGHKKYFSIIPFSDTLENVSLKGFKYDVDNCKFEKEQSLGISNEFTSSVGHISFSKGICLVVRSNDTTLG